MGSSILGCFGQSIASRSEGGDLSLCSAVVRHIWSAGSRAGLPDTSETQTYWHPVTHLEKGVRGLECLLFGERWGCSAQSKEAQGNLINTYKYLLEW